MRAEVLCFSFYRMVDCEHKSVAFSFAKFNAGGRGISSGRCCCSYVSPVHKLKAILHCEQMLVGGNENS